MKSFAPFDRAVEIYYRLRVLEAAQKALAARGGLSSDAMRRLATRERVDAAEVLAKLNNLEACA